MNSFCSFCASAGIKGPHDHFLRTSRASGASICCPKLLSTECNYCHRKGHTVKFCGAKREQQMLAAQARASAKVAKMNSGGWMTVTRSAPSTVIHRPVAVAVPAAVSRLTGAFAGLEMEDPSSSDDEDVCEVDQVQAEEPDLDESETSTTWAQIVRSRPADIEPPPQPIMAHRQPAFIVQASTLDPGWGTTASCWTMSVSEQVNQDADLTRAISNSEMDIVRREAADDDEELDLPPLVFGRNVTRRWADEC